MPPMSRSGGGAVPSVDTWSGGRFTVAACHRSLPSLRLGPSSPATICAAFFATFCAAFCAVATAVCCSVPSALTGPGQAARLAVLAVGMTAFACAVGDAAAAVVAVGVGFLLFDGFVEDRYGDLAWHGRGDLVRLGVLVAAA